MMIVPTVVVLIRAWSRALLPVSHMTRIPTKFWWDDWTAFAGAVRVSVSLIYLARLATIRPKHSDEFTGYQYRCLWDRPQAHRSWYGTPCPSSTARKYREVSQVALDHLLHLRHRNGCKQNFSLALLRSHLFREQLQVQVRPMGGARHERWMARGNFVQRHFHVQSNPEGMGCLTAGKVPQHRNPLDG